MEMKDQKSRVEPISCSRGNILMVIMPQVLYFSATFIFLICLDGTDATSLGKTGCHAFHNSEGQTYRKPVTSQFGLAFNGTTCWLFRIHKQFWLFFLLSAVLVINAASSRIYWLPWWKFDEKINVKYYCLILRAKLKSFLRPVFRESPPVSAPPDNTDIHHYQSKMSHL